MFNVHKVPFLFSSVNAGEDGVVQRIAGFRVVDTIACQQPPHFEEILMKTTMTREGLRQVKRHRYLVQSSKDIRKKTLHVHALLEVFSHNACHFVIVVDYSNCYFQSFSRMSPLVISVGRVGPPERCLPNTMSAETNTYL